METKKIPELSFDLQRIMLHALIQLLHADGLDKSQNAFAMEIGASKAQLSLAMTRLAYELRKAGGVLVVPARGADSVLGLLTSVDVKNHSNEYDTEDDSPLPRLFKQTFTPKVGWEKFLGQLLPEVWPLPWAQELWQIRKLDGWLRGRAGSELAATRVALTVMDGIFNDLRVPHNAVIGWKEVPDNITDSLPNSLKLSVFGNNHANRQQQKWLVHNHGLSNHGKMALRWVIEVLEKGLSPAFEAGNGQWIVHRVRLHSGRWLLDCWADGGQVRAIDVDSAPDQQVASAIPYRQPPAVIKFWGSMNLAPSRMEQAEGMDCVDNPYCMHLGITRGEVFLLDCAPECNWLELGRQLVGAESINAEDFPQDLPEGWATRRIYPRYAKRHASDPAWVEFVSIMLPHAGLIRLRTPEHPEIEAHPMLAYCTGSIDRLQRLA